MTCTDIRSAIDAYIAGTLTPTERERVERHAATCSECTADLESARVLVGPVASLPRSIEPPRDLWPAIARRTVPRHRWRRGLAAAAAVLLIAGASSTVTMLALRDTGPATARSAGPAGDLRVFEATYVVEAASLAAILDRDRDRLAPGTIETLERNLRVIDAAIAESRAALAADPGDPDLRLLLRSSHEQKVALLEQVTRLARET